jgi:hypothetical protein
MFHKPLMLFCGDIIAVPTPYIRGSRFDSNGTFALIATETDLDQKRKGYLPVLELKASFREAGFHCLTDFKVRDCQRLVTDIDLVVFKDEILFLAQCKIVIEPDTSYEAWKAEGKLRLASKQLRTCMDHYERIRPLLLSQLGVDGREKRVVPFILTNTRQFTERSFGGYPVVDIPYIPSLVSGYRIRRSGKPPDSA